jgi:hypothetical protein
MKSISLNIAILILTCVIVTSCTKMDDPPANGLILYYNFNGNINDASGNSNHGINKSSGRFVPGKRGLAMDFNGISDYIQLMNTINSEDGLSFSFWMKSRGAVGTENNGVIIGKYNMTTRLRSFLIYSFGAGETRNDNRLSAAFYKNGISTYYHDNVKSYMETAELSDYSSDPSLWTILNPRRLDIGAWTHCVVNVTSTTVEAWINGVLCTKKQREYATYFDSQNEPVYIGNNPALGSGDNNHFCGILDELRIYSRGLTRDEIQILFKAK